MICERGRAKTELSRSCRPANELVSVPELVSTERATDLASRTVENTGGAKIVSLIVTNSTDGKE